MDKAFKYPDNFKKECEKFNIRLADLEKRANLLNEKFERDSIELEKMFETVGVV